MVKPDRGNAVNPLDGASRERWSMTLAAIMAGSLSIPELAIIVSQGEDEFCRTSAPILQGHAFHREDLKRVFRVLSRTVELNRKPNIADLLAP